MHNKNEKRLFKDSPPSLLILLPRRVTLTKPGEHPRAHINSQTTCVSYPGASLITVNKNHVYELFKMNRYQSPCQPTG